MSYPEDTDDEPIILPKNKWAKRVDYDCGCAVYMDKKGEWYVEGFCNDHDPTICPNEVNGMEKLRSGRP